ncbi:hypothetical protein EKE94_05785 [Mesobaculum littorinae]|uniref:Uncharacterized protein n=1 Tax=Mesobaculum littorinae TaxID=2486419 RepID=A0A438AI60_9RHOB|nr:hypothetical protein [Mesobaculum littorinae]RVV98431.1 hypothetical protein EKE94_05785 [Mesobaculum littorinae]
MVETVKKFFETQGEDFFHRRFDVLSACYTLPLPIYVGSDIYVIETSDVLHSYLSQLRDRLESMGVVRLDAHMAFVGSENDGRFPICVDWHLDGPPDPATPLQILYFCRWASDGLLQTELVELQAGDIAFARDLLEAHGLHF